MALLFLTGTPTDLSVPAIRLKVTLRRAAVAAPGGICRVRTGDWASRAVAWVFC